jgi:hypothetical protein
MHMKHTRKKTEWTWEPVGKAAVSSTNGTTMTSLQAAQQCKEGGERRKSWNEGCANYLGDLFSKQM